MWQALGCGVVIGVASIVALIWISRSFVGRPFYKAVVDVCEPVDDDKDGQGPVEVESEPVNDRWSDVTLTVSSVENIHFGPLLLLAVRFVETGDTCMVVGFADDEEARDEGPRFVKGNTVGGKMLKTGNRLRYHVPLK